MSTDWTGYERVWGEFQPKIEAFMKELAEPFGSEVWVDNGDDYSVRFTIGDTANGDSIDVSLALWDSGDADDGIYGQHGNWVFDIAEVGGRIIGGITPENYTGRVWADYSDLAEFRFRLNGIIDSKDDILRALNQNAKQ
jgi:hypothetical protein